MSLAHGDREKKGEENMHGDRAGDGVLRAPVKGRGTQLLADIRSSWELAGVSPSVGGCRSAGNARIDSARLQRTGREKRTLRVWTQRVCSVKCGGPFPYPVWVACWSRLLVGLPLVRRIRHRPR